MVSFTSNLIKRVATFHLGWKRSSGFQNMVGPGEVDEELQPEVVEECNKYGEVAKVVIYEVGVWY